jgi:hypothetical protein
MGPHRHRPLLLLLLVFALAASCQQPTSDPDQPVRDLIESTTWDSDTVNFPTDAMQIVVRFNLDGTVYYKSTLGQMTWSYKNSVLTVIGPLGTFTTTNPDISASHFYFNYGPGLCHMKPYGT